MERMNDEQLVKNYLDGDEKALELLFGYYLKPIYNFLFRLVGNTKDAEDLSQEAFMKAWSNLKRFDGQKVFKAWIYKIARNTAIDFLRKKKSLNFSDLTGDEESILVDLADDKQLPDERMMEMDLKSEIREALNELPLDYRTVMLLYYNGQLNFREIGEVMGESINTVKSRHRRALGMLRKILLDYNDISQ
jgi:RNA polymerase sigma-70 factor, ECF subfamily